MPPLPGKNVTKQSQSNKQVSFTLSAMGCEGCNGGSMVTNSVSKVSFLDIIPRSAGAPEWRPRLW